MNDRALLTRLLLTCACDLRKECLALTSNDTVTVCPPRRTFQGPQLIQPWELHDIKGSDILRALYGLELKPKEVLFVWDRAVNLLARSDTSALADWLKAAQPGLPFCRPGIFGAPSTMVQFLLAASWYTGDLDICPSEVILKVSGIPLGFSRTNVRGRLVQHRLRRAALLLSGISCPLGSKKLCTEDSAAVHAHLMRVLPQHHRMIDLIFSAAVHAGKDYERLITTQFNVDPDAAKSVGPVNNLLRLQQQVR